MRKALTLLFLIPFLLVGQDNLKKIKNPENKRSKKCKKYYEISRKLPVDVRYSIKVIDQHIIFYFPSRKAFNQIFDKKFDGIAIDIVTRDQFSCNGENQLANSWAFKGELLRPVFKKELERRMQVDEYSNVTIDFGLLPPHFDSRNVECNMILLQKKFHCDYRSFSHIDYNQWSLLEMGLYRDSIESPENQEFRLSKKLTFEIPFEKNRHLYAPSEIKPLYDSLHLSDYYVNSIRIKAYSSVEGDFGNNQRLQNARATSIIEGLQAYQSPQIPFEISTSENWGDFYSDIESTQYKYLSELSKDEIKKKLANLEDDSEMESILSTHRKGLIELTLERKISKAQPNELIELFGQNVKSSKIEEALYIQNFVFNEIENNRFPDDFIGNLEIPKLALFSPLLTNKIIFEYENSIGSIEDHITAFKELLKILPNNPQIQYNLVALKLTASNKYSFASSRKEIWRLIGAINWKMNRTLVNRLKINYHILNTEFLDLKKSYREKNKSLRQIYSIYGKLELTDEERLHLVRFLSIYSQFKWAENILSQRVYQENADSELVDYYLRLTISDSKKLNNSQYLELLRRATNENNRTFCDLFSPTEQGGYTFQLLENPKLADLYCTNCQNKEDDL